MAADEKVKAAECEAKKKVVEAKLKAEQIKTKTAEDEKNLDKKL
jgi:hypothetical protein